VLEPGEEGKIVYAFTIFPNTETTQATLTVTIGTLSGPGATGTVNLEVKFQG
jgi:hypothetical protein